MADAQTVEYQWAYSIMDSSRVSTFLISMLLIVYGSFRSLNMEQEARDRANGSTNCLLNPGTQVQAENNVQTLDTMQALCLPLGASISLLVMFFFFDSMQMLFAICTASRWLWKNNRVFTEMTFVWFLVIATVALAFLLLPMCQYIIRPCSDGNKISFGMCGRFTAAELLSFSLSVFIVCIWVLTGQFHSFVYICFIFCLSTTRSLVTHGRHGHGSVRSVHSFRPTSQSQSLHTLAHRPLDLRRFLGLLLLVHLQRQRDGQGK